jgi:hypothetical protein
MVEERLSGWLRFGDIAFMQFRELPRSPRGSM